MSITYFDSASYVCYPEWGDFVFFTFLVANYISELVVANTIIEEDEIQCTLDQSQKDEAISIILTVWGALSLRIPFNRAVYPLPEFGAMFVDT